MLKSRLNKIACNFIRKKLQHCEICKSACSEENLRTTASVYLKSKLQIMKFIQKPNTFILGFTKYFLTSSALETLVLPNLYLLLSGSQ